LLGFFGAGVGASWPPPEPSFEDPPEDPPLLDEEPPELEPVDWFEELEELGAALLAGGEGSGMKGSRVGPWLWKRAPPGVSETASFGFVGATATGIVGGEPVTRGAVTLATGAGVELPEAPVTAYATAATSATPSRATSGSMRREKRSALIDCRNSVMGSPLRRRASPPSRWR
jgi:hypothetical protein